MNSHQGRRALRGALAVVMLGALALSASACTSTARSPLSADAAEPPYPPAASAPAAAPGAATAPGAGNAVAVPAAAPIGRASAATHAAPAGPTAAQGQSVVESKCVGQCHGASLLSYRTSPSSALNIASSMLRRAGVPADKQQAIALFFAQ